jgi:hypothetical protein
MYPLVMPSTNRVLGMLRAGNPFRAPAHVAPEEDNPWDGKTLANNPNQTRVAGQAPVPDGVESDDSSEASSDEELSASLATGLSPLETRNDDDRKKRRRQSFSNNLVGAIRHDDITAFHRYLAVNALSRALCKSANAGHQATDVKPRSNPIRKRSLSHSARDQHAPLRRSGSVISRPVRKSPLPRQGSMPISPVPLSAPDPHRSRSPSIRRVDSSGEPFNLLSKLGPNSDINVVDHMLYNSVVGSVGMGAVWRQADRGAYENYISAARVVAEKV